MNSPRPEPSRDAAATERQFGHRILALALPARTEQIVRLLFIANEARAAPYRRGSAPPPLWSAGSRSVNSKGFTLNWFAPDTATTSQAHRVQPDQNRLPRLRPGDRRGRAPPGQALGTITRSDGTMQATYNGHPPYTYTGKHPAPGQDKGNGLNVFGGLWYTVPVSGNAAPAATSSATSTNGGGGYGY